MSLWQHVEEPRATYRCFNELLEAVVKVFDLDEPVLIFVQPLLIPLLESRKVCNQILRVLQTERKGVFGGRFVEVFEAKTNGPKGEDVMHCPEGQTQVKRVKQKVEICNSLGNLRPTFQKNKTASFYWRLCLPSHPHACS